MSHGGVTDACDGPRATLARATSRFFLPCNLHIYCTANHAGQPLQCAITIYIAPGPPLFITITQTSAGQHTAKSVTIEAAHSCPNNLRSLAPAYKLVIEAGIIYQINSSVMETHLGQSRRQEVPWPSTATTTTRELYIPSARLITPWIMLIGLSVIGFLQQHGETIELQIICQRILHPRPVQTNTWL